MSDRTVPRPTSKDGSHHVTDERFNTCSHLAAAVFALLATAYLVVESSVAGKPWHIVSFSVYGASVVFLFLASTFHHGIDATPRAENLLRILDYSAVFLVIAGSLTPVCLALLRTPLAWTVFGVNWLIAGIGITLRATFHQLPKRITNTLYLTAGWTSMALLLPIYRTAGWQGLVWLALGGILYSLGTLIYALERPNPWPGHIGFHEIWHLFVIAATAANFAFMVLHVLPA